MASPPFSLTISSPANTDIAANFPTLDRSDKDVIQSWIEVLHNSQGRLLQGNMDQVGSAFGLGSAPTPATNTGSIWYDSSGVWLEQRASTALTTQIGVPIGGIIAWPVASIPQGWLLCNGQSLATTGLYANLFAVLQYSYGGVGSSFNVPNYQGQFLAGVDNSRGYLPSPNTIGGSTAGVTSITLSQGNLPNITWTVNITDPGHKHGPGTGFTSFAGNGGFQSGTSGGNTYATGMSFTGTATTGISGTVASGGSATPMPTLPPYSVVNWIIRAF